MDSLDRSIIASLKNGNQTAFELVFKTYYTRLCTYAFDFTKQQETAEDIVKEFFLDFWKNRENLTIKSSLSGYLFRSVHNACINYLKREKNKNIISTTDDLAVVELKIRQPLSPDYPVGNLLAKELEEKINSEIEKLPQQCREIFVLSRFEGMSHKKIAKKLNISENTVKVQIYRALSKLKQTLLPLLILVFSFFRNFF